MSLRKIFLGIGMSLLILSNSVVGQQSVAREITVVMPQVRPPFDKIFSEILEGIQTEAKGNTQSIVITEDSSNHEVLALLETAEPGAVIGLGTQVKNHLAPLQDQFRVVYGASFLNPDRTSNDLTGISLTPSPDITFKWLHTLVPEIKTVHAVYQEDYSGWLIELGKKVATDHELTLVGHPVEDVREAAGKFRDILNQMDPATHAIWLMQRDPTLDEKAVVPDILAQAWSKNFVIFSNNPSHVPRGALFALYPDNEKMGRSLAKLSKDTNFQGVIPLSDLKIAVNVRTASHVGKNFTRREEKQFDLIFPTR